MTEYRNLLVGKDPWCSVCRKIIEELGTKLELKIKVSANDGVEPKN